MKELEARYSGEWVLLVNPVHNKLMEPIRGELVFPTRTETKSTRKRTSAKTLTQRIFYVGKLLEDLVVVL
jgi:hypothetical protein